MYVVSRYATAKKRDDTNTIMHSYDRYCLLLAYCLLTSITITITINTSTISICISYSYSYTLYVILASIY